MRTLYERIADVLAGHGNVKVKNFLNEIEEARFSGKSICRASSRLNTEYRV